jgi:hypothetical protein
MMRKSILGFIGILLLAYPVYLVGFSGGKTGHTLKGLSPGCTCHGPSSNSGVLVVISGPASLQSGAVGNYAVEISGGPLAAAGFNAAVSAGTLTNGDASSQTIGGELTHTGPKAPFSGKVTFPFTWRAPVTTGPQTIYAVANSVNLSGDNSGDSWNFAPNFSVNVTSSTAVNDDAPQPLTAALYPNYPNPFNPTTVISYQLSAVSQVELHVVDVAGREVAVLERGPRDAGMHSYTWNASDLPSGMYVARLRAQSGNNVFTSTQKLILLK